MHLRDRVRPNLRGIEPYDPGPTLTELGERYGVRDLVKLNWNESLFGPLPGVLPALADEGSRLWMYPEQAYAEFRAAVARQIRVSPDSVVPGHGVQALLMSVLAVVVAPGDVIVTARPTYGLYAQAATAMGARLVRVPVTADLGLDLAEMAREVHRQRAGMVIVCDPNNPTGQVVGDAAWAQFLNALPDDCVVVVDEAYIDFAAPGRRDRRVPDVTAGRPVILLRSFSKLYGLAGLRLGYAVVDPDVAPCFDAVQEPFNVNRMALAAGMACLADPAVVERRRREVVEAREHLQERLAAHDYRPFPSEANFVLTSLSGRSEGRGGERSPRPSGDDAAFVEQLIRRGFVPRGGHEFGMAGHLRITVAPIFLMDRLVDAMDDVRAKMDRVGLPRRGPA